MSTPLHARSASVGSGDNFQCVVCIEGDQPGTFVELFRGPRDIAERLAACWNAQYSVPLELVQAPVIVYLDATTR